MFTKTLLTTSLLFVLAAATPFPAGSASQCDTGLVQCCNQITNSTDPVAQGIAGSLGIDLPGDTIPVGLNCNPITVIGGFFLLLVAHSQANPVCCNNAAFGSLIALGCVPIDASL